MLLLETFFSKLFSLKILINVYMYFDFYFQMSVIRNIYNSSCRCMLYKCLTNNYMQKKEMILQRQLPTRFLHSKSFLQSASYRKVECTSITNNTRQFQTSNTCEHPGDRYVNELKLLNCYYSVLKLKSRVITTPRIFLSPIFAVSLKWNVLLRISSFFYYYFILCWKLIKWSRSIFLKNISS